MSRPSQSQMERLVEFLEGNPGIAKGHVRSAQARQDTKNKWSEIATTLNSLGGAIKDAKAWAKFWADKKYSLKKHVAENNKAINRTGGGVEKRVQPLSEIEERLVFLMGGPSFAEGDQELSVPLGVPIDAENPVPLQEENEIMVFIQEEQPAPSEFQGTQSVPSHAPSTPRRSPRRSRRVHQSQLNVEKQRLIQIEEKRVEVEMANAAGWTSLVRAIDNLSNAIIISADKIAAALQNQK